MNKIINSIFRYIKVYIRSLYAYFNFNINKKIPHFIDGDINRPNSSFEHFKLISLINAQSKSLKDWAPFLMADNFLIEIDTLVISIKSFNVLCKLNKEKLINLKINRLRLAWSADPNLAYEAIENINQIKLEWLQLVKLSWSYDNLIAMALLNCSYLEFEFHRIKNYFWLTFLNTRGLIIGTDIGQQTYFICKSITFCSRSAELSNELYMKEANRNKLKNCEHLFIPFASIENLKIWEFQQVQSSSENSEFNIQMDIEKLI